MEDGDKFSKALDKFRSACSGREYCISEIAGRLKDWNLSDQEVSRLLSILVAEKFIDEQRYASAFVNDKYRHNRWGRIKISVHLKARGIAPSVITEALNGIDDRDYRNTLAELIKKHRRTVKAGNEYELRAKLVRFALSRGFESQLIHEITGHTDDADMLND